MKMLRCLMLILFVNGAVAIKEKVKRLMPIRFPPVIYNTNATAIYDSLTEKCCLGKVSLVSRYDQCCGEKTFNPTKQLCCQGEVKSLVLGYDCCGKEVFDTEKAICCNDATIVETPNAADISIQCCGNNTYNSKNQTCCFYNEYMTIVDIKSPNSGCCGDKAMDYVTELCCSDYNVQPQTFTVFPKKDDYSTCCNGQLMNSQEQGCCNNTVFNQSEKACCYSSFPNELISITKKGEICCGTAKKSYDLQTQTCCGDEVINGTNVQCCGNRSIDPTTQTCCYTMNGFTVTKKTNPNDVQCCGNQTYDYSKICCTDYKNQYAVYSPGNATCCNGIVYDGNGICCDNGNGTQEFHKTNTGETLTCCGSNTYNYQTELCCGNTAVNKSENSTLACCGDKQYNYMTQTCCSEYKNGKYTYEAIESSPGKSCCGSKLVSYADGQGCCGNEVYAIKEKTCCGDTLFAEGNNGTKNSCCYDYMTDNYPPIGCRYPLPMELKK